jgi:hypothetical protein
MMTPKMRMFLRASKIMSLVSEANTNRIPIWAAWKRLSMDPAEQVGLPPKSPSNALRALGVRSCGGAIVLAAQFAAVLSVLFAGLKLAGVTHSPWIAIVPASLGPAFSLFVVVSLYASTVAALHDQNERS